MLEVLSHEVLEKVLNRLQIKQPDHPPDDPYAIDDINQAVSWILTGGGTLGLIAPIASSAPTASTTSPTSSGGYVKQEDLSALVAAFTKLADKMAAPATPSSRLYNPATDNRNYGSGNVAMGCHYC